MKRIAGIMGTLLFALTVLLGAVSVHAAGTAAVYAEEPLVSVQNSIVIPVCIQNNPGMMGFKIHIECSDEITLTSVSRGDITAEGMLTHNVGMKRGEADILWNHSEEIRKDGILFFLGISAQDYTGGVLTVTYSENDTFNEAFEPVALDCQDIPLTAPDNATVVIPENKEQRTALAEHTAAMIIEKNGKLPETSKLSQDEIGQAASLLNEEADKLFQSVPDEIKNEVLKAIYSRSLNNEQTEQDAAAENKKASKSAKKSAPVGVIILSAGIVCVFFAIIIYMRKRK